MVIPSRLINQRIRFSLDVDNQIIIRQFPDELRKPLRDVAFVVCLFSFSRLSFRRFSCFRRLLRLDLVFHRLWVADVAGVRIEKQLLPCQFALFALVEQPALLRVVVESERRRFRPFLRLLQRERFIVVRSGGRLRLAGRRWHRRNFSWRLLFGHLFQLVGFAGECRRDFLQMFREPGPFFS